MREPLGMRGLRQKRRFDTATNGSSGVCVSLIGTSRVPIMGGTRSLELASPKSPFMRSARPGDIVAQSLALSLHT